MRFGERKTDSVRDALAERAGGRVDARRDVVFGVARRDAAKLAELLDIIDADGIAVQMQQCIKQ